MWKDIDEFEGRYQINTDGQIQNKITFNLLTPTLDCDGYPQIGIRKLGNRKKYWFRIHRLVAITFLEKPENWKFLQVDHIDKNKNNCSLINLRWVTPLENNSNRKTTCWKTNKTTGEIYITKLRSGYLLRLNKHNLKHRSYHTTIEEAILIRNDILK